MGMRRAKSQLQQAGFRTVGVRGGIRSSYLTNRTATWFPPVPAGQLRLRKFAFNEERKDLNLVLQPLFSKWGLPRTPLDNGDWDILWGINWDEVSDIPPEERRYKLVNQIPGMSKELLGYFPL